MKKKSWVAVALVNKNAIPTIESLVKGGGGYAIYPIGTMFSPEIMKRFKLKRIKVKVVEV